MGTPEPLRTVFAQNRAEEIGSDVWTHFVVPPFYDRLDLLQARKPRVIIGGRGCGKTMLLRYLSYHSSFSPDRPSIPSDALQHIGLYWRADTQFAKTMTGRGIADEDWHTAFDHLLALVLAIQILDSIALISSRESADIPASALAEGFLTTPSDYDAGLCGNVDAVRSCLKTRLRQFELWINNVKKIQEPVFLPGRLFLVDLIQECRSKIPGLGQAEFFVYIDEYENLLDYQQRIINTYLKHSEIPLIFNIAMKRNGFKTRQTTGEESIIDVADYREHDIEHYLRDEFTLFAAEVLLLYLSIRGWDVPIDVEILRDPTRLLDRSKSSYQATVLTTVRRMFPGISELDLAHKVFATKTLHAKIEERIRVALNRRRSQVDPSRFMRPRVPAASIVVSALLHRKFRVDELLAELDLAEAGEVNRFNDGQWIHNNLMGCILSLYESYSEACPFYAGFDTFVVMARGNLRHFLELCHRSLSEFDVAGRIEELCIDPQRQAEAAKHASVTFLTQVRSFGRLGNRLHTFAFRLGSLFSIANRRPAQSEPERSHFSIKGDVTELGDDDREFLNEAIKWSVLIESEENKQKNVVVSSFQYALNPIYAPYFTITYRKKRRLELTIEEFRILEKGEQPVVNSLLRRYMEKWGVGLDDTSPTLFSYLTEE